MTRAGNEGTGNPKKASRTYTDAEVDAIVKQKLARLYQQLGLKKEMGTIKKMTITIDFEK
ncbi:hypothetical protein [uncultured Vagococcus sp.]|uniref:hypothetical protein n=1 Tax=uncultured Vagococcus sp. TaxID=189676 RepID=UPI0028D35EC4|nr:hypothetical protein [uncultured Vagococcus sp.]